MRMRIISAAVVLGLGIVGIALAQQNGERPKEQATDRAKLRAQVAKLRAEVEFLQLEHEADTDFLKELVAGMRKLDAEEALKGPVKEQMKAFEKTMKEKGIEPAPRVEFSLPFAVGKVDEEEEMEKISLINEATAKMVRPLLDLRKREFLQMTAVLNEKRLELAELEKRYNEAK